jgi:DNA-binding GntR family transcriptional regulator
MSHPPSSGQAELNARNLRPERRPASGALSGDASGAAEAIVLPVDFASVIHQTIDVPLRSARQARLCSRGAPQLERTPMEKMAQLATLKVGPLEAGVGLRRLACDAIKRAITEMNIYDRPEEIRLDERQLSRDLGVSRTPIREALSLLEQEGFVRSVPRRGIYIVRKNKNEIIEMVTVWAGIESMAARLACARATAEELAGLRAIAEFNHKKPSVFVDEYAQSNMIFHRTIIRMSGCALMLEIVDNLFIHMRAIRSVTMRQGDRAQRSMVDHMNILTALEHRDPELAARRICEHTLGLAEHIRKYGDFLDQFQSVEPRKRSYA